MKNYASNDDLRQIVREMIAHDVTQKILAERFQISSPYLSDFLAGRREAGPKILAALEYDDIPYYRRKKYATL